MSATDQNISAIITQIRQKISYIDGFIIIPSFLSLQSNPSQIPYDKLKHLLDLLNEYINYYNQ
jgi:hypothetical protein